MSKPIHIGRYMAASLLLAVSSAGLAQSSTLDGVFTPQQAAAGATLYTRSCIECHGATLRGGEAGPALVGAGFWSKWANQPLGALFQVTASTMPVNNKGGFSPAQYASLIAFILQQNGLPVGTKPLANTAAQLVQIKLEESQEEVKVVSLQAGSVPRVINAEWLSYHGDTKSTHYSPLAIINKDNVGKLEIAWRWYTTNHGPQPEFNYEATPLMVDGVLYTTAGRRRDVVAIDPVTGETLWMYRVDEGARGGPRVNSGRGLSVWRKEGVTRLINVTPGYEMFSIDPATQRPDPKFGNNGVVDLREKLDDRFPVDKNKAPVGSTSPAMIVGDVIVVGATFPSGGSPASPKGIAGNIRGYDVHTGVLLWTFHTVPQGNEFGVESWRNKSNEYTGATGAWSTMSADLERGIVYVPVEAATGDMYGGHRPGNDLFSQTLVALDAKTGKRLWHYQLVHHDVWDYDPPTGPVLADLKVNGKTIPAAIQVSKQGMVYTFNRVTGEPVWPIVEKAVPQNGVPGEQLSATQPFPTKPAPFERLGLTENDLIDFTPELKAEALKILKGYTWGPVFTPPSLVTDTNGGTVEMPGFGGGANWQGVGFDPDTNMLYVPSTSHPMKVGLGKDPRNKEFDYAMTSRGIVMEGPFGLPLIKPPYGRITAIDMNSGDHKWMMANADTPDEIKNNEHLKGVEIKERTGHGDRGSLLVTKTLLFAAEGAGLYGGQTGGGRKLRAHDKATGKIISELELPAKQTGLMMTYAIDGVQYIVVPIGDTGHPGELVALRLKQE
ncbi:MAG TPA: PQQ-binding-like beta-propeller repeat protein [Candidatus Acidoferrum sp.]|nr:PQQ-binding-like beta-propeller repeat protein [Candidatus Acidoferrum sp.]